MQFPSCRFQICSKQQLFLHAWVLSQCCPLFWSSCSQEYPPPESSQEYSSFLHSGLYLFKSNDREYYLFAWSVANCEWKHLEVYHWRVWQEVCTQGPPALWSAILGSDTHTNQQYTWHDEWCNILFNRAKKQPRSAKLSVSVCVSVPKTVFLLSTWMIMFKICKTLPTKSRLVPINTECNTVSPVFVKTDYHYWRF